MAIGTNEYQLTQAHYHAPSEHLIDGRRYSAEVHMVHENNQGDLAVIALLLESGAPNEFVDELLRSAESADLPFGRLTSLNSRLLARTGTGYFRYVGSTTTPPCLEPVQWFVWAAPRTVSWNQIEALNAATRGPNNRAIQPHYGRTITWVA